MEQRGRQSINGSSGATPRARSAFLRAAALVVAGCGLTRTAPRPRRGTESGRGRGRGGAPRRRDHDPSRVLVELVLLPARRADPLRRETDPGVDRLRAAVAGRAGARRVRVSSSWRTDRGGPASAPTSEYGSRTGGGRRERRARRRGFHGRLPEVRCVDLEASRYGGGSRDGPGVAHGAAYARGIPRAAWYGAAPSGRTGPPTPTWRGRGTLDRIRRRGRAPGAWFGFARDGPDGLRHRAQRRAPRRPSAT